MPKKRKARRPNIPLYAGPIPLDKSSAAPAARDVGGAGGVIPARAASSLTQINADYTHIVNDLKRIGVLAGGFIVILIVLSFFIR
jgi:hypothetical protein